MNLRKFYIAIDLGATAVKLALIKENSSFIKARSSFLTSQFPSRKALFEKLVLSINELKNLAKSKHGLIKAVGIGVPGPVDSQKGMVYFFPNISGWHNVKLKSMLEKRTGLKTFIDNDANLMTLAEFTFGAAKGAVNCMCLTLGTGVGAGLVFNGKIYRGSSLVAGELGHMPISIHGPMCNCGAKGHLERFIGNAYLLKNARRIFGKNIRLEDVSAQARKGNKKAITFWEQAGYILGVALSGVINLVNLDTIVIGGGVSEAGEVLFKAIRGTIARESMRPHRYTVSVKKARFGNEAGMIGAGVFIEQSLPKNN